jgi:dTMP kinase
VQRGKFITIEGIEGVGKSTNIDYLAGIIEANGYTVMKTREPGGTPIAERIRDILKEHGDEPLPDVAELLLMFAARSISVNNAIQPALSNGTWVISDRFTDSTRAYQGGGRGFPRQSIEWLAEFVHGDLQPDLTILLDAPVEIAMQRADRRSFLTRSGKPTCSLRKWSQSGSWSSIAQRTSSRYRPPSAPSAPHYLLTTDVKKRF